MDNLWMMEQGTARVAGWIKALMAAGGIMGGRNWLELAHGDATYAVWLKLCDQRCSRLIGLGIFDLADFTWADSYECGSSPRDAVLECLESDDTYGAMMADSDY